VVSGIAFQDDRAVRFAIVNDVALGEGETIQGAVVEEIFEDRVRFARNGTAFEVALSKRKR
jgi:type II secretory pathway component PulC